MIQRGQTIYNLIMDNFYNISWVPYLDPRTWVEITER
jgi:hypothetical protein